MKTEQNTNREKKTHINPQSKISRNINRPRFTPRASYYIPDGHSHPQCSRGPAQVLSIRAPRDGSTGEVGCLFRGILGIAIPVCRIILYRPGMIGAKWKRMVGNKTQLDRDRSRHGCATHTRGSQPSVRDRKES